MIKELVQIESVKDIEVILNEKSENELFTENELMSVKQKNKVKSLGARYLIKKSILDNLVLKDRFNDIEILIKESGKPYISFKNEVGEVIEKSGITNVHLSISHSRNFITGMVILEKDV